MTVRGPGRNQRGVTDRQASRHAGGEAGRVSCASLPEERKPGQLQQVHNAARKPAVNADTAHQATAQHSSGSAAAA